MRKTEISDPNFGFMAANLKIARARHHFKDLKAAVHDYFLRSPFSISVGYNDARDETLIKMVIHEKIPYNISIIVGDLIHNLRSSLDLVMYGLLSSTVDNPRKIQFPFSKNKEDLERTIKYCYADRYHDKFTRKIREISPYEGGNQTIAMVHNLDIVDKHRLIIPVVNFIAITANDISKLHPAVSFISGDGVLIWSMEDTDTLFTIPLSNLNEHDREREKKSHGEFKKYGTFTLNFPSKYIDSKRDFQDVLEGLIEEIDKIVKELEKTYESCSR